MNQRPAARPNLVAIVGGSGSGKSWLADKLAAELAPNAARLSLDDFYRDQSHLSLGRRARINFDHPRAIDWPAFEGCLKLLLANRPARIPHYDFATHSRRRTSRRLRPKPIILLDGLWLLHRGWVRRALRFSVFLECAVSLRLRRRLARDRLDRGRTVASIRRQFQATVEPMHQRYVAPQAAVATLVLRRAPTAGQISQLAARIRQL